MSYRLSNIHNLHQKTLTFDDLYNLILALYSMWMGQICAESVMLPHFVRLTSTSVLTRLTSDGAIGRHQMRTQPTTLPTPSNHTSDHPSDGRAYSSQSPTTLPTTWLTNHPTNRPIDRPNQPPKWPPSLSVKIRNNKIWRDKIFAIKKKCRSEILTGKYFWQEFRKKWRPEMTTFCQNKL